MKTQSELKAEIEALAHRIGAADATCLPTYGYSEQPGRAHIEVDEGGYQYVVAERGTEESRFTTRNLDELLYKVFDFVTFALALDYEQKNRLQGQDFRRIAFQKQIDLFSNLSPDWAGRCRQEQARILQQYPFDDHSSARVALIRELRQQGYSSEKADRIASERYPAPEH